MATNSPPPSSSPPPVSPSPPSNTSPPPSTASPPPSSQPSTPAPTSPPSQPNANPPDPTTPSTPSPPPQPPTVVASPPPPTQNPSPPPLTSPSSLSPPPPQPTISPTPPSPSLASPPPATTSSPPISSPFPPQVPTPPRTPPSPPPSSSTSPPPPPSNPVRSPPPAPPPSDPPKNSSPPPPPAPSNPPNNSPPPPPSSNPPESSPPPPPPSTEPPKSSSPPPPESASPQSPPPAPASTPPRSSPPPPPAAVPPSDAGPPSSETPTTPSNFSPISPPPPARIIRMSPPPPQIPVPPTNNTTGDGSSPGSSDNHGIGTGGVVAIGVAVGLIALSVIGLLVWCLRKRRKEISGFNGVYVMPSPLGSSTTSDSSFTKTKSSAPLIRSGGSGSDSVYSPTEPGGLGNSRSLFMYEELAKATDGFSAQNLLGEGGFGSVYKGYLPDGREVAIKQLKIGGGQGEREFKAEVEIISRIHHRHLVSLVGYCISENQRLLIYDYVPNNTLYFHLHENAQLLDWPMRVKIAAGAARGLAYLHEDCHPRIIHRDIKSSNILLDNNFEARVSDFGLAKLAFDANTHVTTRVMGTFGYMAPEYASSGKLTEKSDVFSFGVVLLELITGRKPVDASRPLGDESLVEWARPLLSHALENEKFEDLADPRLGENYVESEMFRMIEAAAACVRHSAAKRPRMGQVVRAFDNLAASDLTNGMRVGESEIYNSAQQSAEIRWFRRMAFGSQNYSTDFFTQGTVDS